MPPAERQVKPIKSPITWIGSKAAILPILYGAFPLEYERYIEPFGGSGSVLLGKPWKDSFEMLNDYNRDLVNLFRCMRDRPLAFIRELGFLPLNARDDFNVIRKALQREEFTDAYLEEEMELTEALFPEPQAEELKEILRERHEDHDLRRAAMYLKLLRHSYASGGKSFAARPFTVRSLYGLVWQFSRRCREVVIEHQDFEKIIRGYDAPESFFYCDPPYLTSEYVYDCAFSMADHERLRDALMGMQGKFLLSYNDCPKIREMYAGCMFYGFTRPHRMAQRYEAGREFPELLVANYDLHEREHAEPKQISLFGSPEDDHF